MQTEFPIVKPQQERTFECNLDFEWFKNQRATKSRSIAKFGKSIPVEAECVEVVRAYVTNAKLCADCKRPNVRQCNTTAIDD